MNNEKQPITSKVIKSKQNQYDLIPLLMNFNCAGNIRPSYYDHRDFMKSSKEEVLYFGGGMSR